MMNKPFALIASFLTAISLFSLACGFSPLIHSATATSPAPPTASPWPTYPPPMPATYFLGFCQGIAPFDHVNIRKAFAFSIDRLELIDALAREFAAAEIHPATSFVPPDIWPDGRYLFGQVGLDFDPELALSSWEHDNKMIMAKSWIAVSDDAVPIAEFLQVKWKDYLGVDVEVVPLGQGDAYFEALNRCEYPLFLMGWYADYGSPYNFLGDAIFTVFHSIKSSNPIKWKNPEFDQLTENAFHESDPARQMELYMQAEKILTEEEVVIVPLYHYYHTP